MSTKSALRLKLEETQQQWLNKELGDFWLEVGERGSAEQRNTFMQAHLLMQKAASALAYALEFQVLAHECLGSNSSLRNDFGESYKATCKEIRNQTTKLMSAAGLTACELTPFCGRNSDIPSQLTNALRFNEEESVARVLGRFLPKTGRHLGKEGNPEGTRPHTSENAQREANRAERLARVRRSLPFATKILEQYLLQGHGSSNLLAIIEEAQNAEDSHITQDIERQVCSFLHGGELP
jgi:uncharacterized protein YeaC (DUF1315 family)